MCFSPHNGACSLLLHPRLKLSEKFYVNCFVRRGIRLPKYCKTNPMYTLPPQTGQFFPTPIIAPSQLGFSLGCSYRQCPAPKGVTLNIPPPQRRALSTRGVSTHQYPHCQSSQGGQSPQHCTIAPINIHTINIINIVPRKQSPPVNKAPCDWWSIAGCFIIVQMGAIV